MKKLSERTVHCGKWLEVKESRFLTKEDKEIIWEHIERNKPHIVLIVASIKQTDEYILIKQFRPATNNYVIGFPAGLMDSSDAKENALRELKEETGYSGTVVSVSPLLSVNSGVSNDKTYVVRIEVDVDYNSSPQQELEEEEDIEVLLVKKEEMKAYLLSEHEKGIFIGAGLWNLFVLSEEI